MHLKKVVVGVESVNLTFKTEIKLARLNVHLKKVHFTISLQTVSAFAYLALKVSNVLSECVKKKNIRIVFLKLKTGFKKKKH